MKQFSQIKGVDVRKEAVDGKPCVAQYMICSGCQEELRFGTGPSGTVFPEQYLNKKARQAGWLPKKNGRHTCPDCQESKKMTDTAPREITTPERRKIFREVDECYDEKNNRYVDNFTDNSIAIKLGVPRKWVEDIRAENFGPSGENTDMERVASALGRMNAQLTDAINECMEAASKAEGLKNEIEETQALLDSIKKAVGPRAVA